MVDTDALHHAFREYTRGLLQSYDIGETLYWLTDQVPLVIDVDGAGVWLGDLDTTLGLVTATDAQVTRVESQQLALNHGPCLDAFTKGEQVVCNDLSTEDRWSDFAAVALENGYCAVAGLPMPVDHQPIGALNLYRASATPWLAEELEAAQLLADMATGYVVNVRNLDQSRTLSDQLTHALDSRIVIEQAKGLIAGRMASTSMRPSICCALRPAVNSGRSTSSAARSWMAAPVAEFDRRFQAPCCVREWPGTAAGRWSGPDHTRRRVDAGRSAELSSPFAGP